MKRSTTRTCEYVVSLSQGQLLSKLFVIIVTSEGQQRC